MCFFLRFLSLRCHISELIIPAFGRPMQLLRGEVDRFRGLIVCVSDGFSAHRQRGYECGHWKVVVVRICSSSHNFNVFGVFRN